MPRAPATTPARQGELAFDANASYGAAASHIAAELINCAPEQIDAVILRALAQLGHLFGAERASVLELAAQTGLLSTTLEWCADGIPSLALVRKCILPANVAWWLERLAADDVIAVNRATPLPPEVEEQAPHFHDLGVRSLVGASLLLEGQLTGALLFENLGADAAALGKLEHHIRLFARIVAQAMARRNAERRLAEQQIFDRYVSTLTSDMLHCHPQEIDAVMGGALPRLGELAAVDRVRVTLLAPEKQGFALAHEWCAPGVPPLAEDDSPMPLDRFPAFVAKLREGQPLVWANTGGSNTALDNANQEYKPDFQCSLIAPLTVERELIGFLGLNAVRELRTWQPLWHERASLLARAFSYAIARRDAERRLEERQRFDRYLSTLATDLINCPSDRIDAAIDQALATFGTLAQMDQAYVFQMDEDELAASNSHEWCAKGITPQIGSLQHVSLDAIPWWMEQLAARRPLVITDINALPPEAASEKRILAAQDIVSAVAAPLDYRGKMIGFVGFDAVRCRRNWSGSLQDQVALLGQILSHAIARQRTEQALAARERVLDSFLNAISEPAFLVDEQLHFVVANEAIAQRMNSIPERLLGTWCLAGMAPDVVASRQAHLQRALASQEAVHFEDARAGRHYINHVYPVLGLSGGASQLAIVANDITEQKRAQLALAESQANLIRAQQAARLANWTWDLATHTLHCTPAMYHLLGLPVGNLAVTREVILGMLHPCDRAKLTEYGEQILAAGSGTAEFRVLARPDDRRVMRSFAEIVRGAGGRPSHLVGVNQDITEYRRLEEQVAQATKMAAIANLAGEVAHDFGHYLTVMNVAGELLLQEAPGDSLAHHYAERLLAAWEDAAALVRQLHTFSRQQVLECTLLSLDSLVRESAEQLDALIRPKARLALDLGGQDVQVRADRVQMLRVLLNLVSNAGDAVAEAGAEGGVLIETAAEHLTEPLNAFDRRLPPGRYARLTVRDNGIGMSPDTLARVFEPFYSTKRKRGGGLGMAIVYGIVEQHAGTIAVSSSPGEGSAISIYLPVAEAPSG
jgi:signal transduction histidine kinase/GAF domain-containing protein